MEVFLSYRPEDNVMELEETALAWSQCVSDGDVHIIQVDDKIHKSEMIRRIAADNLASHEFYILADIGCIPKTTDLVRNLAKKLGRESADLIGLTDDGEIPKFPTGVRICRKGAVKHWIPKRTATYDEEHTEAVWHSKGRVEIWKDIDFQRLQAS